VNAVPRLSIGLPVYNGESYLAQSLDALLGQSYGDFELIISDNASTEGTADICRRYGKKDSRIRYFRQPCNIGLTPNHNFVFQRSRGELFMWAAADDLYARNLLESCVAVLDEYPYVVLAHTWTATIDSTGNITHSPKYPLATSSPKAPERFRSILFGSKITGASEQYGVIRADVLRRVDPVGSYHHADVILVSQLALNGPFHHIPDWLYFRRDYPDRAYLAHPTLRSRAINHDPRRANPLLHPTARLLAEYLWGFVATIRKAPLSPADRRECYRHLAQWMLSRAAGRAFPGRLGQTEDKFPGVLDNRAAPVRAVVAGQERRLW
jgi:glycosyltransferase involved in cell wall biosynthesis